MLFKLAAQALAERHGMLFSMMPKPFAQPARQRHALPRVAVGGGQDARCLFGDAGTRPLTRRCDAALHRRRARAFGGLAALAAPTVNSYKRLVVGESLSGTSWAPAYVAHGPNNRTALVRTLDGRFEWRAARRQRESLPRHRRRSSPPGSTASTASSTAARHCTDDLFDLPLAALRERGIALLPQSLGEAVDALAGRRGAAARRSASTLRAAVLASSAPRIA